VKHVALGRCRTRLGDVGRRSVDASLLARRRAVDVKHVALERCRTGLGGVGRRSVV
jgi:hypothetical protein